jgi:phage replication-related protein YjqB (UPF0714/DUF867 family)
MSNLVVIAIHGGGTEPGTSEIADEIAGNEHSFYAFEGTMSKGNYERFHTTSTEFTEPACLEIVQKSARVVSIHGCDVENEGKESIFLGGLDDNIKDKIQEGLESAGFIVGNTPTRLLGEDEDNICNKGEHRRGVQIEIQDGLRSKMFGGKHKTKAGRANPKPDFYKFVSAIRSAVIETN